MRLSSQRLEFFFKLLSPLSPVMSTLQRVRRKLYANGILPSYRAPIPVISVGNITLGGAGKTPFVIMLARYLQERGLRVSVVNRGYRGSSRTWPRLVSHDGVIMASSREVGDEAILIARSLPGVAVISGADRYKCVCLSHELGVEIAILDDGFQHLRLKRDLDIVLVDATRDIFKEGIFPGGYLREPVSALEYADCVVITKTSLEFGNNLRLKLGSNLTKDVPIFLSWNRFSNLVDLSYNKIRVDEFTYRDVFVFAGIANPEYFFNVLSRLGFHIVGKYFFDDHHLYTHEEVKGLLVQADRFGAEAIVTTHKDVVKILELMEIDEIKSCRLGSRLYYLDMETVVEDGFYDFLSMRLGQFF